jgi:hypothetical protein
MDIYNRTSLGFTYQSVLNSYDHQPLSLGYSSASKPPNLTISTNFNPTSSQIEVLAYCESGQVMPSKNPFSTTSRFKSIKPFARN